MTGQTTIHAALALHLVITFAAGGCGAARGRPATPCLSDLECRGERICHEGRCRFVEEVRDAWGRVQNPVPPLEPAVPATDVTTSAGFMGDARHTGRSAHRGPSSTPKRLWTYRTNGRVFASPVLGFDGTIYVGSLDKQFVALSPQGKLKWRYAAQDKIYATAAVTTDTIFIGTNDRHVIALNLAGQTLWSVALQNAIDASLTLGPNGMLYVASLGVVAIDPLGRIQWQTPSADHLRSAPAIHPLGLVVVGTPEGTIVALRSNGKSAWERPAGASVEGSASIGDNGAIYVGNDRGQVLAIDPAGTLLWTFDTKGDVRATPAIARDGTIVVGSYDQHIYAISPTGALRWKVPTSGRIRASARIDADGRIYVGSQDNFLYALSPDGNLLWRYNVGQDVDSTVEIGADGTLYVGADDGGIHAIR